MKKLLCVCIFSLVLTVGVAAPLSAQNDPAQKPAAAGQAPVDPGSLPVPDFNPNTGPAERFDSADVFYDTIGKLFVIVGIMLLLAWLARKFLPGRMKALGGGDSLRLVQSLPLGPRRFVSLIEADGKRLLIGVTDNQINLIKSLDDDAFTQAFEEVTEPKRVQELWEEENA